MSEIKESVIEQIGDLIKEKGNKLARGSAQNYPAYRYSCGIMEGLSRAREIVRKSRDDYMLIDDESDDA